MRRFDRVVTKDDVGGDSFLLSITLFLACGEEVPLDEETTKVPHSDSKQVETISMSCVYSILTML